jgi:hypothetical protein
MWEMHKPIVRIAILFSIVLVTACQNTDSGQVANPSTVTTPFTPKPQAVATRTPQITNPPTPTSTQIIPLDPEGPWLISYIPPKIIGISNLDGTGQVEIKFSEENLAHAIWWDMSIHPHNEEFITAITCETDNCDLWVLELPQMEIILQLSLIGEQALEAIDDFLASEEEPYVFLKENENPPVLSAIGDTSWSPDGRYLTFSGAMDGPSSDLYIFDTKDYEVTHLTDEAHQARILGWTPDSQSIVYYSREWQTVYDELIESIWMAEINGSYREITEVNEVSGQPWIADWINDKTLVMYYSIFESNPCCLTTMNIENSDQATIDAPNFRHDIFYAQNSNQLVIGYGNYMGSSKSRGVYRYDLETANLDTIIENIHLIGKVDQIELFYGVDQISYDGGDEGNFTHLFNTSGEIVLSIEGTASLFQTAVTSPNGNWFILFFESPENPWNGKPVPFLFTAVGEPVRKWDFACLDIFWLDDSSGFYCYSSTPTTIDFLRITQANNWEPVLVNHLSTRYQHLHVYKP